MWDLFGAKSGREAGQKDRDVNPSNVVALSSAARAMRPPLSPLRQAEAYWTALRHGDEVPARSSIDPRGLSNILEYAFVLERVAPGVARFRLAGQHIQTLVGTDVRGMPLSALFTAKAREDLSEVISQVFDGPSVAELTLTASRRTGRPSGTANMILLPLQNGLGDVNRALGVVVGPTSPSAAPVKFELAETQTKPLYAGTLSQNVGHRTAAGFAESQTEFTGPPHLQLVVSHP